MPNHIINEVIFERPSSDHAAILASVCSDDEHVDFNLLVPMPAHIWRGSVSQRHEKAFGSVNCGLDWARANWGTKWNAYSMQPIKADDGTLTIRFETAWSPPYPWLVALFNTHGEFRHNWLDEGASRGRAGRFFNSESWGPDWSDEEADDALHRHLHKLHWGVEEFEEEEPTP